MRWSAISYICVFFISLCSPVCPLAWPATITVDTTVDDDVDNGNCTLREAMTAANTNMAVDGCVAGTFGEDSIDLTGLAGEMHLTANMPFTEEDLSINGPGESVLTIHADGSEDSVFRIKSNTFQVTVHISGLRITGGAVTGNGGAIYVYPGNTLNLSSCKIDNNSASLDGGGIINDQAALTLTDCVLANNTALKKGGAIANLGQMRLVNTQIDNNEASENGGGIWSWSFNGDTELYSCTVEANTAGYNGGGLHNDNMSGSMKVVNSSISGNETLQHGGGGIYNRGVLVLEGVTVNLNKTPDFYGGGGIWNNGTMTINASTISNNQSNSTVGGILNQGKSVLTNTTISNNTDIGFQNSAGDLADAEFLNCTVAFNTGGGILNWKVLKLKNTIVANNVSYDCSFSDPITSDGFNLDSDNTCGLTENGDLPNASPSLGPLRNNGGPTWTHALSAGSPAIDSGDNSAGPETDQRGAKRPRDGDKNGVAVCDMGAYEFQPPAVATWLPLLTLD